MYPENTLTAIEQSAPNVDAVEIDVLRCGSGELVVFHDSNLERVTGYDGAVDQTPWNQINQLTVFDSGEPIPRLETVADAWLTDLAVNIDIHQPGIAPEAIKAFGGLGERIVLSSTSEAVLEEVDSRSTVQLGLSFFEMPQQHIDRAVGLDCDFVHVPVELALETDVIDIAHENDLSVDVWTLADRSTAEQVSRVGADAVTVDRWDIVD